MSSRSPLQGRSQLTYEEESCLMLSGKKKNLVNFSCTSRRRGSGMLRSFERRFDLKCEFFPQAKILRHRGAKTHEPTALLPLTEEKRQHITPVPTHSVKSMWRRCHGNSNADWLQAATDFHLAQRGKECVRLCFEDSCFLGNWSWDWLLA
jgi:hypothetical protein